MNSLGRWKHAKREIIEHTLARYVDMQPKLIAELTALMEAKESLNKGAAAKIVSARLGKLVAVPQTSEKYWTQRGWSEEEAVLKSRERKLTGVRSTKNIKSPFGREHWLLKINPETGNYYTTEEADLQRNAIRPIKKEYWLKQGFTEMEAIAKATKAKDKNNRNGGTKNSTYAQRTIGYYIVRGFNETEARELLSLAQATFTLEKLIKKYGQEEGTRRWQERQSKWQATLNSKSLEEQEDINQRKTYNNSSLSKISLSLFEKINYVGARWGKKTETSKGELMVRLGNNKRAMIDFAYGNKLIEFYGDYWHANPQKYGDDAIMHTRKYGEIKADAIRKLDADREAAIKALGYELLIIWENDYKTDPQGIIEKCKTFLNS